MNLSATGLSASTGSADLTPQIPGVLSGSGASASSGDAVIVTLIPLGAVRDLGVWPATLPDPAMSLVGSVSSPGSNGRTYLSATAPNGYATALGQLWPAAATVAATATWQETTPANTKLKAITDVQLERAPSGNLLPPDAADYRDQLVYEQSSTTVGGVVTYDAQVSRVSGYAMTGTWCGQLVNSGGVNPYSMNALPGHYAPVVAGAMYRAVVHVSIARANANWYPLLVWYDANFNEVGFTTGTTVVHPGSFAYQQGRVRGPAPTASGPNAAAAWAAVIPVIVPAAVGDGEIAYVDNHRIYTLTQSLTSVPQAYAPARQQNIILRANRINYAQNPSLSQNLFGWWSAAGTTSNPGTWDSTVGRSAPGSMKMAIPYGSGGAYPRVGTYTSGVGSIAQGKAGETFTLSAYVLPVNDCPQINILVSVGGDTPSAVPFYGTNTSEVEPDDEGWYRLSVTCTIPQSTSGSMGVIVYVPQANWDAHGAEVDFWVDDLLVEPGSLVGDYFDAAALSPDYLWEATPFQSRSHYYANLRFLQYRLGALLSGALPVGVPYQVLYAQPDS